MRAPLDGWTWFYIIVALVLQIAAVISAWTVAVYVVPAFVGGCGFWLLALIRHDRTVRISKIPTNAAEDKP